MIPNRTDKARPRHDRDGFVETAEGIRKAIDTALADPALTMSEARVLLALVRDVGSWARLWDHRTRQEIATAAGVSERSVTRALARLADLGAVVWEPSDVRGRPSRVGFVASEVGETGTCLPNGSIGETAAVSHSQGVTTQGEEEDARVSGDVLDDDPDAWDGPDDLDAYLLAAQAIEALGGSPDQWPPGERDDLVREVLRQWQEGADPLDLFATLTTKAPPRHVQSWTGLLFRRLRPHLTAVG